MKRISTVVVITLALSLSSSALAAQTPPSANTKKDQLPPGYQMCPKAKDLHQDKTKKIWFANYGWLSYSASFAKHISKFLGAQWQGVKVGNISCLYQADNHMTFPIVLQYNRLVYEPQGGHWSKNLGGYSNCVSSKQSDCIFKPQPKQKHGDIYQEADQLKSQHQQERGF